MSALLSRPRAAILITSVALIVAACGDAPAVVDPAGAPGRTAAPIVQPPVVTGPDPSSVPVEPGGPAGPSASPDTGKPAAVDTPPVPAGTPDPDRVVQRPRRDDRFVLEHHGDDRLRWDLPHRRWMRDGDQVRDLEGRHALAHDDVASSGAPVRGRAADRGRRFDTVCRLYPAAAARGRVRVRRPGRCRRLLPDPDVAERSMVGADAYRCGRRSPPGISRRRRRHPRDLRHPEPRRSRVVRLAVPRDVPIASDPRSDRHLVARRRRRSRAHRVHHRELDPVCHCPGWSPVEPYGVQQPGDATRCAVIGPGSRRPRLHGMGRSPRLGRRLRRRRSARREARYLLRDGFRPEHGRSSGSRLSSPVRPWPSMSPREGSRPSCPPSATSASWHAGPTARGPRLGVSRAHAAWRLVSSAAIPSPATCSSSPRAGTKTTRRSKSWRS